MPCALGCLALAFPRLVIVLVVIFSDYLGRAYETTLWPLLGFFFMPLTTLAYAWAINTHGELSGFPVFVVILAALCDLGMNGNGARQARRERT